MLLTYKYRVKDKSAAKWLRGRARSVNQVWNYCVAHQRDAEQRYRAGSNRRWASNYDLQKLTAGTSADLGIYADTVAEVCRQFAHSRKAAKGSPKFRASFGSRRALGWIPFKGHYLPTTEKSLTYLGRKIRLFGTKKRPLPANVKAGSLVEDARGRWWAVFAVDLEVIPGTADGRVGIDLGLKTLATLSSGQTVEALQHYRQWEARLSTARRAGNKRRVRAIHSRIANTRRDHLHKASTKLVEANNFIAVGDVSSSKLAKTRMAKSVLDAGWASFKHMLRYKCQKAGAVFVEVTECFTSQTCSACGVIPASSPKGMGALGMRSWVCECGAVHDRDVNAARNILRIGLSAQPRADESRNLPTADKREQGRQRSPHLSTQPKGR